MPVFKGWADAYQNMGEIEKDLKGVDAMESKAGGSFKPKIVAKQLMIHGCTMKMGKCLLYLST